MAKQPLMQWCFVFGAALMVVALLAPNALVPPAWWQGGWQRQCFGSAEEVELLSSLAAILMPKLPVSELFRSFPSPDEEDDLEPTMTAYGVMKDPNVALFVLYDGKHGKRENITHELRKRLLAYGPPGSHILHISHTESRPLEDMVLSIKVGIWHPGDEASLSLVLDDIRTQVSIGLKQVLCPEVLKQLDSQKGSFLMLNTHVFRSVTAALRGAMVKEKLLEHRFFSKGFNPASTNRMLKSAHLIGRCVEAKLASRIQCLLDLNQSQTSSPALGDTLQQDLKSTVQWLSDLGVDQRQLVKTITSFPSILCSIALQNLEVTMLWLLDLGLSQRQVVKVAGCCPEVFDAGKATIEWFDQLGMTKNQIRKAACAFPLIFACSIQEDLIPMLNLFLELGLTKIEIAKLIAAFPHILSHRIEKNLKPKVGWFLTLGLTKNQLAKVIRTFPQSLGHSMHHLRSKAKWLLQLGMARGQVVKVIAASPQVLGYSLVENLKPKVEWFVQLGMARGQIVKVIVAFPLILSYSLEQNLKHKVRWLVRMGMTQVQVVKVITAFPQVFCCSMDRNLKPKVEWFLQLGLTQGQVAKFIAAFPPVLGLNIERNLVPKTRLLQDVLGAHGLLDVVLRGPRIMGLSYLRLSTRLMILVKRNETAKLVTAMKMTTESFKSRFLDDV